MTEGKNQIIHNNNKIRKLNLRSYFKTVSFVFMQLLLFWLMMLEIFMSFWKFEHDDWETCGAAFDACWWWLFVVFAVIELELLVALLRKLTRRSSFSDLKCLLFEWLFMIALLLFLLLLLRSILVRLLPLLLLLSLLFTLLTDLAIDTATLLQVLCYNNPRMPRSVSSKHKYLHFLNGDPWLVFLSETTRRP